MRQAIVVATLLCAAGAFADGGFIPLTGRAGGQGLTTSAAQKAVIIRDGAYEILLLQTTYSGPAEGFAWVIPVPARPAPGDIFVASADFLKGAFLTTQPREQTMLANRWPPLMPVAGLGEPEPERVTVWREDLVGDYRAAVLSATGGGALARWLRGNGYAVPAALGPVAEEYAHKGWSFVALKLNQQRVPGEALLKEVQPLGLRFRAEQLVFPLRISTISAPDRTALLLVVYAADTVLPRELPTVGLGQHTDLGAGDSYYRLVRKTLNEWGGRALLIEERHRSGPDWHDARRSSLPPPAQRALEDGQWRQKPGPTPVGWPLAGRTRFFGLLPREAMVDLTFQPGPSLKTSVSLYRYGRVRCPSWAEALWRGWPQLLVMLALGGPIYWRRCQRSRTASAGAPAAALRLPHFRDLGVALGVVLALAFVLLPSLAMVAPHAFLPVMALIAVWNLAKAAAGRSPHRLFWMTWCTVTVAVVFSVPHLLAHTWGRGALDRHVTRQLSASLEALDGALKSFVDTYHCYPATLADLTVAQPTQGLDASGNLVAITAKGAGQPVLERLPVDPLTGHRDTWVYDVLSPGLVDSGGYQVAVSYSNYALQ